MLVHMRGPSGMGRWALCGSNNSDMGKVNCPECLELLGVERRPDSEYGESLKRQVGGDHYTSLDTQPWDAMSAWHPEQFVGYLHLSAIDYLARAGKKGDYPEDIKKAHHVLERLIEVLEEGV